MRNVGTGRRGQNAPELSTSASGSQHSAILYRAPLYAGHGGRGGTAGGGEVLS